MHLQNDLHFALAFLFFVHAEHTIRFRKYLFLDPDHLDPRRHTTQLNRPCLDLLSTYYDMKYLQ